MAGPWYTLSSFNFFFLLFLIEINFRKSGFILFCSFFFFLNSSLNDALVSLTLISLYQ